MISQKTSPQGMWEQRPDWDSAEGARQDLGRAFQVKRIAGAQEPARDLGDKQEGLCDYRREGGGQKRRQALMALVQWLRLWN